MQNPSFMILMCLAFPCAVSADEPTVPAQATVTAAAAENGTLTATDPPPIGAAEKTPAQQKREAAEATIRRYGVNGYKPQTTTSGDVVYCKMEAPVGSRFEVKQCRTFQQVRDESLNGKEYLERLQRIVPPNKS
jgi:outer membrane receptor for Fe3+-dicitrate